MIRRCAECAQPKLLPISRRMQVYSSVIRYKCSNCAAEVDITPMASIGVFTMAGILALSFWGWIVFGGSGAPGYLVLSLFGGAGIVFFLVIFSYLAKHFLNPLTSSGGQGHLPEIADDDHIARKPILFVERLGYFSGMLIPLAIITGVLGISALIGYINFTFF